MQRYPLVTGLSQEEPVRHRATARRPPVAAGGGSQLYPHTAEIIHTSAGTATPTTLRLWLHFVGAHAQALAPISSDMAKVKKKLTPAQKRAKKAAKAERQKKYQWVFMNGKQVRIKRPRTVDGIPVDQFIEENADPIWLHQNELWELMPVEDSIFEPDPATESETTEDENGIPF